MKNKKLILIALIIATSVSSKQFDSSFVGFKNLIQVCIQTGEDGSGNKTGEDGSGNKTGEDGSGNKTGEDGSGNKTGEDGSGNKSYCYINPMK